MTLIFLFCFSSVSRALRLRRVRDSNPRYDVMRIPHFECGSFDHSDNSPSRELRLNTIRNTIAHGNFRRVPALPKN